MGTAPVAVPDEAPDGADRDHSACTDPPQDRGDPHSPEAQAGDYDVVLIASPTWWFPTCMPIRSYLESPEAKVILNGKPFATVSISRRYYSINLGQQRKLAEKNGGRFIDKTHFVAVGGQVKSMLSWLGYIKHGEPQRRVMGLKMPAPNLQPDFEKQARTFANQLADSLPT